MSLTMASSSGVKDSLANANGPVAAGRTRILIVEDDIPLGRFLSRELEAMGFRVNVHHDGESALENLKAARHDLMILDLNLPKMDGMALLEQLRELSQPCCPVLVLSARTRMEDVVLALNQGADDCLGKPFSFQEMVARIRSLLRRSDVSASGSASKIGDLTVDREQRRVMRGTRRIDLTPREFAILEYLVSQAGKPVTRADLMREVWHAALDPTTNIIDVYMKYLRDKVDGEGEVKLIHTVRGIGYVLSYD